MAVLISSSCGVSLFFIIIIKKKFFLAVQHVGSQVPHQGWNPHPLHWKRGILTTAPPEKSQE